MTFHAVSKKAPKALSYTLLVTLWIALEYFYMQSDFSWPWLLLGNGFSNDLWAVQWYEYTGIFGGSLWVLISNLSIFELVRGGDYRVGCYRAKRMGCCCAYCCVVGYLLELPKCRGSSDNAVLGHST